MKFKLDERGFVLAEFAIALPLLILLLYSLGMVTFSGLKIAREQVADYVLETEAQYVIDRITTEARAARTVKIKHVSGENIEEVFFIYHTVGNKTAGTPEYAKDILEQRRYTVYSPVDSSSPKRFFQVYAERKEADSTANPISGGNSFGKTFVLELKFDKEKLYGKILHVKFKLQSDVTGHIVEFNTAVFMPACKKIIYHGDLILDEE